MRECGLKSVARDGKLKQAMSLPMRECGLKSNLDPVKLQVTMVTPYAGVWIEIMLQKFQ